MSTHNFTVHYMLTASGGVALQKINIALSATIKEVAEQEASKVAAALHAAGYYHYNVFDMDPAGISLAFHVSVEQNAPTVTCR